MTNTENVTADAALDQLASEGWACDDASTAIDSLIESGLEADQPDEYTVLTQAEVEVVREQLRAWGNQQVRACYQEDADVWMVGIGHDTDGTADHWEVDEWVSGGFDGYNVGREAAEERAHAVHVERGVKVAPTYNPVGRV